MARKTDEDIWENTNEMAQQLTRSLIIAFITVEMNRFLV